MWMKGWYVLIPPGKALLVEEGRSHATVPLSRQDPAVRWAAGPARPRPCCAARGPWHGVGSAASSDQGSPQAAPTLYQRSHHLPSPDFTYKGSKKFPCGHPLGGELFSHMQYNSCTVQHIE